MTGEDDIVINEVNSQGDDFVELLNVGTSDVDVSGWVITDNDPTHVFTFASGTVIPAGGLLLVGDAAGSTVALGYGLGSADSVVLFTPFLNVVDEYHWTEHIASAGRCPDGIGAYQAMSPSPGGPNLCL